MKKVFSSFLIAAALMVGGLPTAYGGDETESDQATMKVIKEVQKLLDKRLYKQAAEVALKHLKEQDNDQSGNMLSFYCEALNRLGEMGDGTTLDSILEEQLKQHAGNPHFLMDAAAVYLSANHQFKLVDGQYVRAARYRYAEFSGEARDRVRALQCMMQAIAAAEQKKDMKTLAQARLKLADMFMNNTGGRGWGGPFYKYANMSNLTDLNKLPDFISNQEAPTFRNVETLPLVTAGDGKKSPVWYHCPTSWDAAANDGERAMWLMKEAAAAYPDIKDELLLQQAGRLNNLLSYATVSRMGEPLYGPGNANSVGGYNPAELKNNQTVIQTGRVGKGQFMLIDLPEDYNFIKLAEQIAPDNHPALYFQAIQLIANEFMARNQRPAAVALLKQSKEKLQSLKDSDKVKPKTLESWLKGLDKQIDDITKPNGLFEQDNRYLVAGEAVTLLFSYRNATAAKITAQEVDVKLWQQNRINKLLDTEKAPKNNSDLLESLYDFKKGLVEKSSYARYLGKIYTGKTLKLTPGDQHLNQTVNLPMPTDKAGWYLLTVELNGGKKFHRLVTLNDLMLVRRSVPNGNMWYVANAKTGHPVQGAEVQLLRYGVNYRNYVITKKQIKGAADAQGVLFEQLPSRNSNEYDNLHNFEALITHGDSYLISPDQDSWQTGRNRMWTDHKLNERVECVFMTNQPVYRPGQVVHIKGFIYRPDRANPGTESCANKSLTVKINTPTGDDKLIPEQKVTTDETGCFEMTLNIPAGAPLGTYNARVSGKGFDNMYAQLFRMEEYKKPEFTVDLKAPEKPIRLGQAIPVTVQANYYAGGPVTEGKAHITIVRNLGAQLWTPYWEWGWLYGAHRSPYFFRFSADMPLTVLEKTVDLDGNGQAKVELPTTQDAKDFPTHNITYNVSVRVTDASLREIAADGRVIATCKPFTIFTGLNRGFAPVGAPVQATITAATADGVKVAKAKGTVVLVRLNADGTKHEMATWPITTDDKGEAVLSFRTGEAGLYSLITTLADEHGEQVEGALDFFAWGEGVNHPFKANPLSITPDKKEYAPTDTAKLLITSDYADATVWAFMRNSWADEIRHQVTLKDQTAMLECPLKRTDMPNVGVHAFTVRNGELHRADAELLIPPAKQVLTPTVNSDKKEYQPQEKGHVSVLVKGPDGNPVKNGTVTLAVYDKSLEYIARPNFDNLCQAVWNGTNSTDSVNMHIIGNMTRAGYYENHDFTNLQRLPWLDVGDEGLTPEGVLLTGAPQSVNGAMKAKMSRATGARNAMDMDRSAAFGMAAPAPAAAPMVAGADEEDSFAEAEESAKDEGGADAPEQSGVALRSNFADSIKWCGTLKTDENGMVTVPVDMPDNLTTWKAVAWVITTDLQVGQANAEFLTTKDFMVSLQAPRFFVEKDKVMLSAVVRNRTKQAVTAKVSLLLKTDNLAGDAANADQTVTIPAESQVSVNWWTTAMREGTATVVMSAEAGSLKDAMQMNFPVLVHGMRQVHTGSAVLLPADNEKALEINIPQQRRREESDLMVNVSPSFALSMVDALPYLTNSRYNSIEQTLNRFVPALIVTDTLKQLGLDPTQAPEAQRSLNPQKITDRAYYDRVMQKLERNPVYSQEKLLELAQTGLNKIRREQRGDGSWSWFSGSQYGDPFMTANVVHGLKLVENTAKVPKNMINRAVNWLNQRQNEQVTLLGKGDKYREIMKQKDTPERAKAIRALGNYRLQANALDVLIHYVLLENGKKNLRMQDYLVRDRLHLPVISQVQLAEILLDAHRTKDFKELMPVLTQYIQKDDTLQTAWLRLPEDNCWWRWYGSSTATQAAFLKLMAKHAPEAPVTAGLAKWLVSNRAEGSHWDSTKTTADCLEALSAYLFQTREGMEPMEAEVLYDGVVVKTIRSTKETLFTYDPSFTLKGKELTDGKHVITVRRKDGTGNIYVNSTLGYFTLEDHIPAAGNALTVERSYYLIKKETPVDPNVKDTQTDDGELKSQGKDVTKRIPLKDGDEVASGDIIEVVMTVKTKNDVEYLILRDPKPAGCESTEVTSGFVWMRGASAYKEIGDEDVRLFMSELSMGEYQLKHRLRAERPGKFSAMPTVIEAMYAPELRGNSNELKIGITLPKE